MDPLPHLPQSVQNEFNGLFLGVRLGKGIDREVYAHALDPTLVVKLELMDTKRFANIAEWRLWEEVKWMDAVRPWFAPCVAISHSGSVLIQKRTKPIKKLPSALPNLFTDLKPENFGRLGGRIVIHDYALNKAISTALGRFKVVDRTRDLFSG